MKKILILFLLLNGITLQSQTWTKDYFPGTIDSGGKFMAGTEMMQIVSHKGKLYAGNSYWKESDVPNNPRSAEIIRLDNSTSLWQVDKEFTDENLRIGTMKSFVFETDLNGATIVADTLLITIPNNNVGNVNYYVRDDVSHTWTSSNIATIPTDLNCRAIGFYKDPSNNISYIFAGLQDYGIFSGRYNISAPGKIQWTLPAEFITPNNERVMGFTVCNNQIYTATSDGGIGHIYKRTDGTGNWVLIKTTTGGGTSEDIRGLSSVPNPNGIGEVLWYSWNNKSYRLDPNNSFSEVIEYDYTTNLTNELGIQIQYVLAAYNDNIPVFNPSNSTDDIRLIGFEMRYNQTALISNP